MKSMRGKSGAVRAAEPLKLAAPLMPAVKPSHPSIGLALGGGGARGLAHILMLEVFDELGLRPSVIAGTSIGAIFAAAYASGLSAKEIRAHTEETLTGRFDLLRDLFSARARRQPRAWNFFSLGAILAPDAMLDLVLPSRVKRSFAELTIPLKIVASDFYALEPVVFTGGPLRLAVAASMALPAIFEPVMVGERAMIDGGLTNPLPFDLVLGETDVTVAIDVSGAPVAVEGRRHPTATEALFASSFIFERTIIREKLKQQQPDIYIDAGTSHFQVLDFLKVREILAAAEPAKDRLKSQLTRVLEVETLPEIESVPPPKTQIAPRSKLLKSLTRGRRRERES